MSLKTILAVIGAELKKIFGESEDEIVIIVNKGIALVTKLLVFLQSPAGLLLETVIGEYVPAALVTEFTTVWLPKVLVDLNWVKAEATDTPEQIITQGLSYAASLSGSVKAAQLNSLSALINEWVAEQQGVSFTIQQSLTVTQPAFNPALGVVEDTPVAQPTETTEGDKGPEIQA